MESIFYYLYIFLFSFSLNQASEEYREHSQTSEKSHHRRRRSQQHVVEQRSTSSVQESSSVTTRRSSTQKDSIKQHKFRDVQLNHIPLPSTGGVVTCEYIRKGKILLSSFCQFLKFFLSDREKFFNRADSLRML